MTTAEAAVHLGVTQRQIERLIHEGQLGEARTVGRTLLVAADPVHRLARRTRQPGRPWSERIAWAALSIVSGSEVDWLSAAERTRLTHRLRRTTAPEMQHVARNRAEVRRFRSRRASMLAEIADEIVPTAGSVESQRLQALGLTAGRRSVDGYVPADQIAALAADFGLVEDVTGAVTLRAVTFERAFTEGVAPRAVVALDLSESLDTREQAAGLRELARILEDFSRGR